MAKIDILCFGKTKFPGLVSLESMYLRRIRRFADIQLTAFKSPAVKNDSDLLIKEGKHFQAQLSGDDRVMACDESGRSMDSRTFSRFFCRKIEGLGSHRLVILIGGPGGLWEGLKPNIDWRVSFSPMTFAHDLFRTILLEQIFRAYTIHRGITYHR
jgi:23S rRNA (pseudouridine1915-N3)-methyltransferase